MFSLKNKQKKPHKFRSSIIRFISRKNALILSAFVLQRPLLVECCHQLLVRKSRFCHPGQQINNKSLKAIHFIYFLISTFSTLKKGKLHIFRYFSQVCRYTIHK